MKGGSSTSADDSSLILLGGTQCSGSALLSLMMDCHPAILAGRETNMFAHPGLWRGGQPSVYVNLPARALPISSGCTWVRPSGPGLVYHFVSVPEMKTAAELLSDPLQLADYVFKIRMCLERKLVRCDRSDANMYSVIPALERYPRLRAIALVRNVLDVIGTAAKQRMPVRQVLARWLTEMNLCRAAQRRFGSERILILKFEDLLDNPLAIATHVCRFAHVDVSGAQSMVECRRTLRLETDTSVRWSKPVSPLEDAMMATTSLPSQVEEPLLRILNGIRISDNILSLFGGSRHALDAQQISEEFCYPISWDRSLRPLHPFRAYASKNPYYQFGDQLLGLLEPV